MGGAPYKMSQSAVYRLRLLYNCDFFHFRDFRKKLSVAAEEYPLSLRESKHELSMRKIQKNFLIKVFGKKERPFSAAGEATIESLAGDRAEIVVTTVRISATNTGYSPSIIAAGKNVLGNCPDSLQAEFHVCAGICLITSAVEIVEMSPKNNKQSVSSPREVPGFLFSLCEIVLYIHRKYSRGYSPIVSPKDKFNQNSKELTKS